MLRSSSLSVLALMPELGCLIMDQSPVVLIAEQTQMVFPIAEQKHSISKGLHINAAPNTVQNVLHQKKGFAGNAGIIYSVSPRRVSNKPCEFPLYPSSHSQKDHRYAE